LIKKYNTCECRVTSKMQDPNEPITEFYFKIENIKDLKKDDKIYLYKGYDDINEDVVFILVHESTTITYYLGRVLCPNVCGYGLPDGAMKPEQAKNCKYFPLILLEDDKTKEADNFIIGFQKPGLPNKIPGHNGYINSVNQMIDPKAVYARIVYSKIATAAYFFICDENGKPISLTTPVIEKGLIDFKSPPLP